MAETEVVLAYKIIGDGFELELIRQGVGLGMTPFDSLRVSYYLDLKQIQYLRNYPEKGLSLVEFGRPGEETPFQTVIINKEEGKPTQVWIPKTQEVLEEMTKLVKDQLAGKPVDEKQIQEISIAFSLKN